MKKYPAFFLAFALSFAIVYFARAQSQQTTSIHIERIQQISGSVVGIAQDDQSFMWFGGSSGLNRYDGYEVKTYTHDAADDRSLSDTWIERLLVDREGTLWVGTRRAGLDRYDVDTDTFINYDHDPDDPTSLSSGFLYYWKIERDSSGSVLG